MARISSLHFDAIVLAKTYRDFGSRNPSRSGFMRKFKADIPSTVSRGAPDFCTVYVISKGKVSTMRNASRPAPFASPLLDQIQNQQNQNTPSEDSSEALYKNVSSITERTMPVNPRISVGETFR